ncbi:glycosyltransferase [Gillisia hiemivivida]|uniref:Glycosyltransferase n=1 Tax=Gillisia hiemivivida TaxID=291190 RepID=A0A5C6ZSQ7_9FLAO|nr:glycosyltransferase [Gillisia hiemivivida]TXD91746.1 glycosyltransferase [Gillisia hiemivivida]
MQFFVFLLLIITCIYAVLIISLLVGWFRIKEFKSNKCSKKLKLSIIIPFRNEAENLPDLLLSLSDIDYPKTYFEIILVNDESEDNSLQVCHHFKQTHPEMLISVINNNRKTNSPKKDALATAIDSARFEYIITTDADCVVPTLWLQSFNEKIIETGATMIAAPVSFFSTKFNNEKFLNYLVAFQELDFMGLQAAGIGGFGLKKPFLCNGANLCYEKKAFYAVEGFQGNSNISSGDDVFLLQKFKELNYPVCFLKSEQAIVYTKPQASLQTLFSQRIRWAAKTTAYKSVFAKLIGLSVLLVNLFLGIGLILALLNEVNYEFVLFSFLIKFLVDLALLYYSAAFFRKKTMLSHYLWCSLLYPFFSTMVAILSLFSGFEWKGRSFKK